MQLMAKDTWRPKAILKPKLQTTQRTDQEQQYKGMQTELHKPKPFANEPKQLVKQFIARKNEYYTIEE